MDDIDTNALAAQLGISTAQGIAALGIAISNIQTLDRKQHDYGRENIAAFGEFGCLVRCNDKIERLKNLHRGGKSPNNEAVEDSWLDLSNYCIIAVMCRRGAW